MKKSFSLLILFACLLHFSGCNLTSSDRIQAMQSMVAEAQQQSSQMDQDLQTLKDAMAEMRTQLDRPDLKPEDWEKIESLIADTLEKTELVIAKKQQIDIAIGNWKAKIDAAIEHGSNVGDELTLWAEGLKEISTTVPSPLGVWVGLIGTFLGAVGVGVSRRYKTQLNAEKTNTVSVVSSVNKLLDSPVVANTEQAKAILLANQSGAAIDRVREIKTKKA